MSGNTNLDNYTGQVKPLSPTYSLLHPSSRKRLFKTDKDHHRKPQTIKMHNSGIQFQWLHLQNTSTPKKSGNTAEKEELRL